MQLLGLSDAEVGPETSGQVHRLFGRLEANEILDDGGVLVGSSTLV